MLRANATMQMHRIDVRCKKTCFFMAARNITTSRRETCNVYVTVVLPFRLDSRTPRPSSTHL